MESPRIVLQRIKDENVNILVGSVYMPTNGDNAAQQKYREMATLLTGEVTKHRDDSKVILMGDFNIKKKHSPQRKEIFNRIATDLGLVINTPDTYTNTDYKGAKSTLDYILHTMLSRNQNIKDRRISSG